jgi:hypothetical protein
VIGNWFAPFLQALPRSGMLMLICIAAYADELASLMTERFQLFTTQ